MSIRREKQIWKDAYKATVQNIQTCILSGNFERVSDNKDVITAIKTLGTMITDFPMPHYPDYITKKIKTK